MKLDAKTYWDGVGRRCVCCDAKDQQINQLRGVIAQLYSDNEARRQRESAEQTSRLARGVILFPATGKDSP